MKIKVTQEVIDRCVSRRIGWSNPCPITYVLRQQFPREYVIVNGIHILAGKEYKVPLKMQQFLVNWDKRRTVDPISFKLVEFNNSFLDKVLRVWKRTWIYKKWEAWEHKKEVIRLSREFNKQTKTVEWTRKKI